MKPFIDSLNREWRAENRESRTDDDQLVTCDTYVRVQYVYVMLSPGEW